jgi:gliding motility-associated-like protein
MKSSIIALLLTVVWGTTFGQENDNVDRCSTDAIHQQKMLDPDYAQQFLNKKLAVREYLYDRLDDHRMECDEIFYIPVAVHYQNITMPEACAIEKALDQIRILNEDFGGTNADITRWDELQPEIWPAIQNAESCIRFCLATLDHPAGFGLATGDYAVTINQTNGSNAPQWAGYLNFFVRDLGGGLLGFSPLGGSGNGDGTTVGTAYWSSVSCGGSPVDGTYGLGRTASHEVGHYFLLEHPFGNNCTNDNDGIADTPITDDAQYGCPYNGTDVDANELINCTNPILWCSYMDYVDDACMFMFSQGQVDVMDAYANTSLDNLKQSAISKCQDAACIGFKADITVVDETCAGNDGSIALNLEGGTEPFLFSINGGVSFQNNSVFQSLEEETFQIFIVDENNCEIAEEIELAREIPPLSVLEVQNAFCGDNSGRVQVAVDHPDVFEFSITGQPGWRDTSLFTGLFPGTYTVSIRNATECSNSVNVVVGDNTDLNLNTRLIQPVNCPLFDNGIIWTELGNGLPPYLYTLNNENAQNNGRFDNLSTGTYTVTVEDARGCREEQTFEIGVSYLEIAQDCPCDVFVPNAITANGDGLNDLLRVVPACPITDFNMQIFDRWGAQVFETDNYDEKWNGGMNGYYTDNNLFFYRMTFRWGEAQNESLEVQIKSGYVQVLR